MNQSIINAINGERASSGTVDFTVILKAEISYGVLGGRKKSISRHLDATCREISIALPDNSNQATLAGGSKACTTHIGRGRISALGIALILGSYLVGLSVVPIKLGLIWSCQRLERL